MRPLPRGEFQRLFDTCASAFRLEHLQVYRVPTEEPRLHAFQAGQPLPPSPWAAFLRDSDATFQRVHVVREPLTDYLRYEIRAYRDSVEAGEDVRIAVLNQHPELDQLKEDWWGFNLDTDQPVVVRMRYDDEGRWHGQDEDLDPAVIERCRAERDFALSRSVRLRDYLEATSAGA